VPATLFLVSSPVGLLPTSVDDIGVLVLTEAYALDSLDALFSMRERDVVFVAAFEEKPGHLFAVRAGPSNAGGTVVARAEVESTLGREMVEACAAVAGQVAEQKYESWQLYSAQRVDALRAVMTSQTVGEA